MRFQPRTLSIALCGLTAALVSSAAAAASTDLASHLLTQADAPPGFSTPHVASFTKFTRSMTVHVNRGGSTKLASTCLSPLGLKHDGWVQGVIQAFDSSGSSKRFQDLKVCAWQFRAFGGAQAAYGALVAESQALLKHRQVAVLSRQRIGVSSLAVGSKTTGRVTDDEVVFQHGSVVVQVQYYSAAKLSAAAFMKLAGRVNARL